MDRRVQFHQAKNEARSAKATVYGKTSLFGRMDLFPAWRWGVSFLTTNMSGSAQVRGKRASECSTAEGSLFSLFVYTFVCVCHTFLYHLLHSSRDAKFAVPLGLSFFLY